MQNIPNLFSDPFLASVLKFKRRLEVEFCTRVIVCVCSVLLWGDSYEGDHRILRSYLVLNFQLCRIALSLETEMFFFPPFNVSVEYEILEVVKNEKY